MATILTPVQLTTLSLAAAKNQLILANKVDWSYTDKFSANSDNPIGASINIRRPILGSVNLNNMAFTAGAGNFVENFTTLIVNTTATAFLTQSECDAALRVDEGTFFDRYGARIGEQMGEILDTRLYDALVNGQTNWTSTAFTGSGVPQLGSSTVQTPVQPGAMWSVYGDGNSGTASAPGTLTALALRRAIRLLDEMAAPKRNRFGILTPAAQAQASNTFLNYFNPNSDISDIYRTGYMGEFSGVEWAMSQSPAVHTNGAWAGTPTSDTTNATYWALSTWAETGTISLNGLTATTTLNAGDMFTIANVFAVNPKNKQNTGILQQFTVLANVASAASSNQLVTVSPCPVTSGAYQNVTLTANASASVTLLGAQNGQYQESVVFVKEAIAAAAPSLFIPKGHNFAAYKRDKDSGFGIRMVQTFDALGAAPGASGIPQLITRFDSVVGYKVVRPEWCVRIRTSATF